MKIRQSHLKMLVYKVPLNPRGENIVENPCSSLLASGEQQVLETNLRFQDLQSLTAIY